MVNLWTVNGSRTRVRDLVVTGVPRRGTVVVRCSGCAFKTRTVRKSGRVRLTGLFKRRTLRAGTVLEIRITAPGFVGKVVRFTTRARKLPNTRTLCLPPGADKPTPRCG